MSTKTSKIYAELASVLKIDCKDAELSAKDKEVLVEAIAGSDVENGQAGVSDALWFGLTEEARSWVEVGIKAIGAKEEIAAFADMVTPEPVEETTTEEAPAPSRPRTRAAAPVEEKETPPSLAIEEVKEGGTYKVMYISGDAESVYQGKVEEITKRSIIFEGKDGAGEVAIPKRDIEEVFAQSETPLEQTTPEEVETTQVDEVVGTEPTSLLVKDAAKGTCYLISAEDDPDVKVEAVCIMVTGRRGVFDEEPEAEGVPGVRHRLDLDAEIYHVNGTAATVETAEKVEVKEPAKPAAKAKTKAIPATVMVRKYVCIDPEITVDVIQEKLEADGLKCTVNTIKNVFNDTLKTLEVLKDLDALK
jgi:hypothetical protein